MTDTKELRRLLAEATPGEWQSFIGGNFVDIWAGKHSYATVGLPSEFKVGETNYRQSNDGSNTRGKAVANAALIVALRNAAPELLARLERAEVALKQIVSDFESDYLLDGVIVDEPVNTHRAAYFMAKAALTAPEETPHGFVGQSSCGCGYVTGNRGLAGANELFAHMNANHPGWDGALKPEAVEPKGEAKPQTYCHDEHDRWECSLPLGHTGNHEAHWEDGDYSSAPLFTWPPVATPTAPQRL